MKKSQGLKVQGGLFAVVDGGQARPTPLTLVDQSTKVVDIGRPETRPLVDQSRTSGRPVDQTPTFDSSEEAAMPSRAGYTMRGARYHTANLLAVDIELKKQPAQNFRGRKKKPQWQDFVDAAMANWLAAGAPRLVDWSTTCSSSCCSGSSKVIDPTTTTTTTLVDQSLPSFEQDVLNMPHDSRHPFVVLREYAWESHGKGDGIKSPDVWALRSYQTGKHDVVVDLWADRKRSEREAAARKVAEVKEREEQQRANVERLKRESEERAARIDGGHRWEADS